jgi:hypothetical protein
MSESATSVIDAAKWESAKNITAGGYAGEGRTYMWKNVMAKYKKSGEVEYHSTALSTGQWTVPDGTDIYFPDGGEVKRL